MNQKIVREALATSIVSKPGISLVATDSMVDLFLNRCNVADRSGMSGEINPDSREGRRAGFVRLELDLRQLSEELGRKVVRDDGGHIIVHPAKKQIVDKPKVAVAK